MVAAGALESRGVEEFEVSPRWRIGSLGSVGGGRAVVALVDVTLYTGARNLDFSALASKRGGARIRAPKIRPRSTNVGTWLSVPHACLCTDPHSSTTPPPRAASSSQDGSSAFTGQRCILRRLCTTPAHGPSSPIPNSVLIRLFPHTSDTTLSFVQMLPSKNNPVSL